MVLASIVSRTFKVASALRLVRKREGWFRDMPKPGPGEVKSRLIGHPSVSAEVFRAYPSEAVPHGRVGCENRVVVIDSLADRN